MTVVGGMTRNPACIELAPTVAVIMASSVAVTGSDVMGKSAVIAPAGTGTLAGTLAVAVALDRLTTVPPAGATRFRSTCR